MAKKPNLLFIFTDQQRFDTLACYGNTYVQTPNLNRLANESVVFENTYVTQPVCTPARSSIMTGLYPHSNGCVGNNIPLRPETPTIAEMVSPDYARAYIGKWHLGDEVIAQHGFETWISIMDRYRTHVTKPEYLSTLSSYYHFLVDRGYEPDKEHHGVRIFSRRAAARLPEPYTKARFVGREAARFLRKIGDRPFILYVNFFEPHPPFIGPFDDLYPPQGVPVGPHFRQRPPQNAALVNRVKAEAYARGSKLYDVDITTEAGWRRIRAKYLGLVTLVDRAVGDILQALGESGLRENTLVVFTSDHGDMMGDHSLFQKGFMYQASVKVPLLVRVPWLRAHPRRVAGPFGQIDLVPTLLDLLQEPIPDHLQGHSWASILAGKGLLAGTDVVVEWHEIGKHKASKRQGSRKGGASKWLEYEGDPPHLPWDRTMGPWRSIVSADGFKLNLCPEGQCELYDLNSDPFERMNLFDIPDQRPRIRDMAARLRAWQEETDDTMELPVL